MTIYVQKLSIPLEEWDIDVEASDTIEAVKQKLMDKEGMGTYEYSKIYLFKDTTELSNSSTLSDYGIPIVITSIIPQTHDQHNKKDKNNHILHTG